MMQPVLHVRGARTHNLAGVDLDLPLRGLTVFVGPSGSGKTSLALDTLHAASRARLSAALGSPVAGAGQPRVARLEGLPLTLAVGDRSRPREGARVADLAGLGEDLAAWALARGVVRCPDCGRALHTSTTDQVLAALEALPEGSRLTLLAPVARGRVGGLQALVEEIGAQGFARVRIDGVMHRIEEVGPVDARLPHDLDLVVDRLVLSGGRHPRLEEAVGTALAAGHGRVVAALGEQELGFAERPWCPEHPRALERPRAEWLAGGPGARCGACQGTGSLGAQPCADCEASGLRPEVRCFTVGQAATPWPHLLGSPLRGLAAALELPPDSPAAACLRTLEQVGLGDLPANRTAGTLAEGELRRLLVARALLTAREVPGLMLILDEPTAGLDPETAARVDALLAAHEGPLLVVEHRRALVDLAVHAVAFGPGAGRRGGRVQWQGPGQDLPEALLPHPADPSPAPPAPAASGPAILLRGARLHGPALLHTAALDASFPRGGLSVVTGPSGSGKTALLVDTLVRVARLHLGLSSPPALPCAEVSGLIGLTQVLSFERGALQPGGAGRSPSSCVATVLGCWAPLRELLAATRDARILGLDAARFRFDRPGGRCEACEGSGLRAVEVPAGHALLAEAEGTEPCPVCEGHRFQRDTLRVRLKGRTVAELLDTDVQDAAALFGPHRSLGPPLLAAQLVGLGYLPLGQPACTLSGGEAGRLRLARELARAGAIGIGDPRRLDDRLLVLDGPTVGLHPRDVAGVVDVLRRLADRGATVVAASVEPALLAAADRVLRLGPPDEGTPA